MDDFITVNSTGAAISFTGSSARVAIPNSGNNPPRYVRLASTQPCYVKLGDGTVAATVGDLMISPGDATIVRCIGGPTFVAALQASVAGILQISPLDDA